MDSRMEDWKRAAYRLAALLVEWAEPNEVRRMALSLDIDALELERIGNRAAEVAARLAKLTLLDAAEDAGKR